MPKVPPYPAEFRRRAVELVRSSGEPMFKVARELGVSETGLRNWVVQADVDKGRRDGLTSVEKAELSVAGQGGRRPCRWVVSEDQVDRTWKARGGVHTGGYVAGQTWRPHRAMTVAHVGAVRARAGVGGRPSASAYRMITAQRVQLVTTISMLELVVQRDGHVEVGGRRRVNFECSFVATPLQRLGEHCHIGTHAQMLDDVDYCLEPNRRRRCRSDVLLGARHRCERRDIRRESGVFTGSAVTQVVPPRTLVASVRACKIRAL